MNRNRIAALIAAAPVLATTALAQQLVTLEGAFPSGGEFTIHPPNACGFPNPDHFVWFLPDFASTCGLINPFTPPPVGFLGDAALDKIRDIHYMTDGLHVTGYNLGIPVVHFDVGPGTLLPGAITGIGYDSENDKMWLTDGSSAVRIAAPPAGCSTPAISIAPFALPTGGGLVTDIEVDTWTDTLWICENSGQVTNVTTTGAIGPGAFFLAGNLCAMGPLTGLAFDTCQGSIFVTDGIQFEHSTTTGAMGPATFYAPNVPCTTPPPPGPPSPLAGLAFSPRPQKLGTGCATAGSVPEIGFTGNFSVSPNPAFGVNVKNAYPGGTGVLLLSLNASCPAFMWGLCEVYAVPVFLMFTTTIDPNGDASIPLPIPAIPVGGGIGTTVIAQWLVQPPVLGKQASEGLSFTLSTM